MRELWNIFYKGLFEQNPIFRLALSLCPALAVTSTVVDSLGMGLAVLFVITANNTVVSIFRNYITPEVRVPVFITIIATLVTLVQLVLSAYFPEVYASLGIYLALIVVFAIILARAEVFAIKNPVIPSFFDGLGMGMGFCGAMLLIGVIRELLGTGELLGHVILSPSWYDPALIWILPPGAFLLIGLLIGFFNMLTEASQERKLEKLRKEQYQANGGAQ